MSIPHVSSRLTVALLWLLHWLPLPVQAAIGYMLGGMLYQLAAKRRRIALRNLELCMPELSATQRTQLVREHFTWLTRSLLERGVLWFASPSRLKRLIKVQGDVTLADTSDKPVMWLVPHFVGLDIAGLAAMLYVNKRFISMYQRQTNVVFDEVVKRGRTRLGKCDIYPRGNVRALLRGIREGMPFFNLPDMDFGSRESVFAPFFGIDAATLTAPARMAQAEGMIAQPVIATLLPRGKGYLVSFDKAWLDWPSHAGDAVSDEANAAEMNKRFEQLIRKQPAQYLWVHKRFKTRPAAQASLYT
jgi:Kdo2-lipid IVA lauroyltransferase/acyltransferase